MTDQSLSEYAGFVQRKLSTVPPTGLAAVPDLSRYHLFPHQIDLVGWALKRGRAAIFADTGLGKSRMQVAWADCVRAAAGDIVLSPFMGIGSEGYVSLEMGRKFVGVELKRSYFEQAARNLASASQAKSEDLFAEAAA